jgi:hypothetical protein
MYEYKHTYKYLFIRVYARSEYCMNGILAFIIQVVYTCLSRYTIHTWHRLGCTYDTHVCTCLIVVHNKNMEKHSVLSVLPEVFNFILSCTAHVRCMYYDIIH